MTNKRILRGFAWVCCLGHPIWIVSLFGLIAAVYGNSPDEWIVGWFSAFFGGAVAGSLGEILGKMLDG